ncbi:PaaI family thioesterase [Fluviicola taffensis]|uniref:Phenylacetic acid degradation-related protein n=1 Tax=Fluviicola taffensis (strain DSM 16823 / NCIMB 13979 / RW262) TaxID=755732 RepID=F2I9F8_FLUTR|nr:PaaI family thioesterase [Fluviicola taffensis]AEA45139.1 phenylacetic acid degradation-related protein [Fluviicola taffensis DSM 16823]
MIDLKQHPIIKQYIIWNRFGDLLGMDFEVESKGHVLYKMTVTNNHLATPFAAHGGSVAALIDAALGVACLTEVCEDLKVVSTVNLTISYLIPALKDDVLLADAQVIKSGKRILFVEGKITNQKGELVATASATMNAYPVSKISEKVF